MVRHNGGSGRKKGEKVVKGCGLGCGLVVSKFC